MGRAARRGYETVCDAFGDWVAVEGKRSAERSATASQSVESASEDSCKADSATAAARGATCLVGKRRNTLRWWIA